jgi:hypothetical protein
LQKRGSQDLARKFRVLGDKRGEGGMFIFQFCKLNTDPQYWEVSFEGTFVTKIRMQKILVILLLYIETP